MKLQSNACRLKSTCITNHTRGILCLRHLMGEGDTYSTTFQLELQCRFHENLLWWYEPQFAITASSTSNINYLVLLNLLLDNTTASRVKSSQRSQYLLHHNLVCAKRQRPIAHTAHGTVSLPGERYNGTSPSGESLAHLQLRGFGRHAFPSTVGSESGPEVVRSIHFLLFYGVIDDLWLHRQACMSWWWPCPAICI